MSPRLPSSEFCTSPLDLPTVTDAARTPPPHRRRRHVVLHWPGMPPCPGLSQRVYSANFSFRGIDISCLLPLMAPHRRRFRCAISRTARDLNCDDTDGEAQAHLQSQQYVIFPVHIAHRLGFRFFHNLSDFEFRTPELR